MLISSGSLSIMVVPGLAFFAAAFAAMLVHERSLRSIVVE